MVCARAAGAEARAARSIDWVFILVDVCKSNVVVDQKPVVVYVTKSVARTSNAESSLCKKNERAD